MARVSNLSATVNTISGFKFSKCVANSIIAKPVDLAIVVGFSPSIIDTVANSLKPSARILLIAEPNLVSRADEPTINCNSRGCLSLSLLFLFDHS